MREIKHAPKSYSIQNRQIFSATPDRNSNGRTFASCGCRVSYGCFCVSVPSGLLKSRDIACRGKATLMSVDSGERRRRPESAFTFSEQAARFQREGCQQAQRPVEPDELDVTRHPGARVFNVRPATTIPCTSSVWANDISTGPITHCGCRYQLS
jgi:hypothetical protein